MDDIDTRLIALLRADARMNVATLAAKLSVARGTVAARLRKLEDDQVIVGYTVKLRPQSEPNHIRAWIGVQVDGNRTHQVIVSLPRSPCMTQTGAGISERSFARARQRNYHKSSNAYG